MIVAYGYPIGQFFFLRQHTVPAIEADEPVRSAGATVTDRDQGLSRPDDSWPRFAWWVTAVLVGIFAVLSFFVLARYQQNGPPLDAWTAICRAIGVSADDRLAGAPQPPLRTPTRIAWTRDTLARVASGSEQNGALVALNCGACHGENGVSPTTLIPTLGGMDATVIYKQLDDYRSGKRLWGVMSAIAHALTIEDSADVAAYLASRPGGLVPVTGEGVPESGRSLRQSDPAIRLVFAGDPGRGILLAPPVMALALRSSGPRRCKASMPPTSSASSQSSPRACGRTTSMSKCGQSPDSSRLRSRTHSPSITGRKVPPGQPGNEAPDQEHGHLPTTGFPKYRV